MTTNDDWPTDALQPPAPPAPPQPEAAAEPEGPDPVGQPDQPEQPDPAAQAQPGQHRAAPEVGSVAAEAVKLFGALADMARQQGGEVGAGVGGAVDHAAATMKEINDHLATDAAECKYCPVCRTVNLVRETSPEVRAHLTSAASSLLQAAAGLLETLPQPGQVAKGDADIPPRGAAVEHIDLDAGEEPAAPAAPAAPAVPAAPAAHYPPDPPDYPMTAPPPAPPAVADPRPGGPEATWSTPPPPPASDSWTDSWMGSWADSTTPRGSGQP